VTSSVNLDEPALIQWMDEQQLGHGPLTDLGPLGGGTQNVVLAFSRAGRRFVLRMPPEHKRASSDETMRREARILAALAGSRVPHPRLIAACPDDGYLGAAFYLMEPVDGFNPAEDSADALRADRAAQHALGLSMIDSLLALAEVDVDAVGLADLGSRDRWLERQARRWARRLARYRGPASYSRPRDDLTTSLTWWLQAHLPPGWHPGLVHGDYHLGNVLVSRNAPKLAAIVDWELATIGDPLLDLGHLLATWPRGGLCRLFASDLLPSLPTVDELIAHYAARSNRDLTDLHWYRVLAGLRLGAILEGTYVRSLNKEAPAELGARFRALVLELFDGAYKLAAARSPGTRAGGA